MIVFLSGHRKHDIPCAYHAIFNDGAGPHMYYVYMYVYPVILDAYLQRFRNFFV